MVARIILVASIVVLSFQGFAQKLDQHIDIHFSDVPLGSALQFLSESGSFDYSYNAAIINADKLVSLDENDIIVRDALRKLIPEKEIQFKERKGQIIIYKIKTEKVPITVVHQLLGQVTDYHGKPLDSVFIIDPNVKLETWTNSKGEFSFVVPNPNYSLKLELYKEGYYPKKIDIKVNSNKQTQIILNPIREKEILTQIPEKTEDEESPLFASVDDKAPAFLIPASVQEGYEDTDTLHSRFGAVGLFPPASTKGLRAGKELNKLSFHALTDYGAGIDGFALSGLASVYKYNVNGLELSGLANYTGGSVSGVQFAGLVNSNILYSNGLQVAGLVNVDLLDVRGVQVSGIINVNRANAQGLQLAGIGNYTKVQSNGIQLAGIMNSSRDLNGIQVAGILNRARYAKGLQFGLINSANRVDGIQFGLINVSDSLPYGLPIGLFNFVRNGYHQIEISYGDMDFIEFSLRSGVQHFYTGFKVGIGATSYSEPTYRLGYHLGTEWTLIGPLKFNLEGEAYHVTENPWTSNMSLLSRAKAGLAIGPKGIDFFGTINYTAYYTDYLNSEGTGPAIDMIRNVETQDIVDGFLFQQGWSTSFGMRVYL